MAQRLRRGIANPVTRKRFPGSNPGPGVTPFCDFKKLFKIWRVRAPMALKASLPHTLPDDLRKALARAPKAKIVWEDLTPLARNEWICWIVSVRKEETRQEHIERIITQLQEGKRRPCCWIGCVHRTDKEISPSVRGILSKRSKK